MFEKPLAGFTIYSGSKGGGAIASQEEICLHLPQQQVWKQEIECDNVGFFLSGRVKVDNTPIELK